MKDNSTSDVNALTESENRLLLLLLLLLLRRQASGETDTGSGG